MCLSLYINTPPVHKLAFPLTTYPRNPFASRQVMLWVNTWLDQACHHAPATPRLTPHYVTLPRVTYERCHDVGQPPTHNCDPPGRLHKVVDVVIKGVAVAAQPLGAPRAAVVVAAHCKACLVEQLHEAAVVHRGQAGALRASACTVFAGCSSCDGVVVAGVVCILNNAPGPLG